MRRLNWPGRLAVTVMLLVSLGATYEAVIWLGYRHVREQIRNWHIASASDCLELLQKCSFDCIETRLLLARVARHEGRMKDVRANLISARGLGCPDQRILFEQSLTLAYEGRMSDVERQLPGFLAGDPDDLPEVCNAFVTGYLRQFRFEDARRLIDVWQRDYPDDSQPGFHSGCIFQFEMRLNEAIVAFESALAIAPHRVEIRERLAVVLVQNLDFARAMNHYQWLLKLQPTNAEWLVGYGICLFRSGDAVRAREVLAEAVTVAPKHREARLALVELAADAKQYDDALRMARELYSETPNDYSTRYVLVRMLRTSGRMDEAVMHDEWIKKAEESFREVSSLTDQANRQPGDPRIRYEIAIRLIRYAKYAEAVGWLRAAHQLDPDSLEILDRLVEACELAGFDELATFYRRAHSAVVSG
ncbi:MAG: tetratricopeptide repeat protein [Rhodopirellula sp.]|nr:tetratricopeptide repeat protein [Rhodopirellula sp.]